MDNATIALLTDFGFKDTYVGVMKCVIADICPDGHIIDLCHEVPPQNVLSGSYLLASAAPFLPEGAVVVGVVDPGVGSHRRAIAIDTGSFYCVGPDNGLFDMLLRKYPAERVVALDNPNFHQSKVSATFHGRDIFAPAAAHLAAGASFDELGEPVSIDDLVGLPPSAPHISDSRIECHVIHVDRFGNLITNLTDDDLDDWLDGADADIRVDDRKVPLMDTFASVSAGRPLAYFGSSGQLELAVRDGSAARYLSAGQGSTVVIERS